MKVRAESLRDSQNQTFDVCVIGAGATGAGCALDAQLRGLSTILLDAGDFGGATSSASTKLAHGGIRYLQQAVQRLDLRQLSVIYRALRERGRMLHNAPQLARACDFLIPAYRHAERLYYALGMKMYDALAGAATLAATRVCSSSGTLAELPDLRADGLVGSVIYADGQFDDARFCIALVKSFTESGGTALNYCEVVSFEPGEDGRLQAAQVRDRVSGEEFRIRSRVFINATGPYSDHLRGLANPALPGRLVLSRGVHILLPLEPADRTMALLIPQTEDGRVLFAIPWMGRLLVGTTDEEVEDVGSRPVTRQEADYLLRHLNRYIKRHWRVEDIESAFAGVRPLVRQGHRQGTKKLIRDHEVERDHRSGLISVLGGKWTTYRAMAEDAVDVAQQVLGRPDGGGRTREFELVGASGYQANYWRTLVTAYGVTESVAHHLGEKHGTRASEVLDLLAANPRWRELIVAGSDAIQAEVAYAIRSEMAITIEDVLARRIGLQFFSWKLASQAAPVVADFLAAELGWKEATKREAIRAYLDKIECMQSALLNE